MRFVFLVLASLTLAGGAHAETPAPWGVSAAHAVDYAPNKVVYDVVAGDVETMDGVLDRASYLSILYDADPFESSIVLVLHGEAVHLFARKNFERFETLMTRAQSLTVGTTIEYRLCEAAARMMGYGPDDFHGFVSVVPMADAELVRLQSEEGYAYMR